MIVRLVLCYVHSSSLSLLWNGYRLDNFAPTRGLCQGDLISPYLFVLCMEKFAIYINQFIQEKKWLPFHISSGVPSISHLFFVDDVLLFCKGKNS